MVLEMVSACYNRLDIAGFRVPEDTALVSQDKYSVLQERCVLHPSDGKNLMWRERTLGSKVRETQVFTRRKPFVVRDPGLGRWCGVAGSSCLLCI